MLATVVMEALQGLFAAMTLPVSMREDVTEISKKQLSNVQGTIITSNLDETTMIFTDGSCVTRQGNKVFIVDGKQAARKPIVVKTTAAKAFIK